MGIPWAMVEHAGGAIGGLCRMMNGIAQQVCDAGAIHGRGAGCGAAVDELNYTGANVLGRGQGMTGRK